ncbi:MAG TPA: 50S ribosomal protein L11 methyltransferase [Xanthomonadaceae bacterium]|nr:50S ribosomal protein L11 methyltransferase [Xanthomonadaceae bacterium]
MPFLELSIRCREAEHPRIEAALESAGALSVTLQDADAETLDERAIFEPGVGETPLWHDLMLTALFDGDTDPHELAQTLRQSYPTLDWSSAELRDVPDQDWERAWMDQYVPLRFGARTWIVPWNHPLPIEANTPDVAVLRLDPGLAFGSGTHPTTALCLRWLDGLAARDELHGASVLDFGCGSGILALAALKLGAAHAVGVDNDPQALLASRDNAQRNDLDARFEVFLPADAPTTTYPVVVANILASALDTLAETLSACVAPGGRIALSGILEGQQDALLSRYAPWFDDLLIAREGDWLRIDGRRRRQAL